MWNKASLHNVKQICRASEGEAQPSPTLPTIWVLYDMGAVHYAPLLRIAPVIFVSMITSSLDVMY